MITEKRVLFEGVREALTGPLAHEMSIRKEVLRRMGFYVFEEFIDDNPIRIKIVGVK